MFEKFLPEYLAPLKLKLRMLGSSSVIVSCCWMLNHSRISRASTWCWEMGIWCGLERETLPSKCSQFPLLTSPLCTSTPGIRGNNSQHALSNSCAARKCTHLLIPATLKYVNVKQTCKCEARWDLSLWQEDWCDGAHITHSEPTSHGYNRLSFMAATDWMLRSPQMHAWKS